MPKPNLGQVTLILTPFRRHIRCRRVGTRADFQAGSFHRLFRPYLNVTIWLLAASSGFRRPMPVIV